MRRPDWVRGLVAACVFAVLASPAPAVAQDDQDDDNQEGPLPAGHPAVGEANPHEHPKPGAMPGMFQPPQDLEQEDPTVPSAAIAVDLRDADDQPVVGELVMLGSVDNSVAKGETRRHVQALTNEHGRALFTGLETASSVAYRVSSGFEGGSFAATPFRLDPAKGMHVVLHVYHVTRDLGQAMIVGEMTVAGEVRDDRIQLEEVLTLYNLGRTAWQPDDVRLALPAGFGALNAQLAMSDQGVDEVPGGAKLRGTFAPGRHAVQFQWQLPWSGEGDMDFSVGVPPHVAIARVMMPVSAEMTLAVDGFPPAQIRHDGRGQRFLVTERQMRPEDPKLTALAVAIHGLPTLGPGRLVASLLSAFVIALGLFLAFSERARRGVPAGAKGAQTALLEAIADLEQAHRVGDVGPRTYERTRAELVDALARMLA